MNQNMSTTLEAYFKGLEDSSTINKDIPFIIRLDGRSFSKFTKQNCKKPFDPRLHTAFYTTTLAVCEHFRPDFAQTFSDEISLIFLPKPDSPLYDPLFGGKIQKIVSVTAAFTTARFIKALEQDSLSHSTDSFPHFDSRIFNVPVSRIDDYFTYRLRSCVINSVSVLADTIFSSKQLHGKNCNQRKEMLLEKGIDWEKYPDEFRIGTVFYKKPKEITGQNGTIVTRMKYTSNSFTDKELTELLRKQLIVSHLI